MHSLKKEEKRKEKESPTLKYFLKVQVMLN
jgi:hypothetical protein